MAVFSSNRRTKKKVSFSLSFLFLGVSLLFLQPAWGGDSRCPGADAPPPPVLKVEISSLIPLLERLKDSQGRRFWETNPDSIASLQEIFDPSKTKLEQFFHLLYLLQQGIPEESLPVTVHPPGITGLLVTAKVFTDPSFPERITAVELARDDPNRAPRYRVQFSDAEVRFSVNQGKGFAVWDQGMCQIARELVFYPGFSFRVRKARNSKNLIVEDFQGVELYGQFGTRKVFKIDLNYVDLEKVEFIRGTDQGKVKARVARREFKENKHSRLFRFIGSLIPNTSKQRIDW